MNNIKAIIFDFGGVIFNIDFNNTCIAFEQLGVKDFNEMYSLKTANPLFQHLEEGKLTEKEFYHEFRKLAAINLENDQIKNALNALLLSYRKEALQTLKSLKHKYSLYLLSNTNKIHQQAFNKIYKEEIKIGFLHDYFDKVYYSHEIGYRKPAPQAYERVLKENNLIASEVFVH